jgi:RNA polymerase sigma factor (sigma-70 family)
VDRLSLEKLVDAFVKLRPRLETVAQKRAGSRATAEDLLQDAWLKLENSRVNGTVRNPRGFITRIATCAVTDHLRKEKRRAEIDAEVADLLWSAVDEISPERIMIARESWAAIGNALDELPERTRQIFLMNRIDGIPHRKIAETLGITDEAVYYHIRRALERLARLRDELAG